MSTSLITRRINRIFAVFCKLLLNFVFKLSYFPLCYAIIKEIVERSYSDSVSRQGNSGAVLRGLLTAGVLNTGETVLRKLMKIRILCHELP